MASQKNLKILVNFNIIGKTPTLDLFFSAEFENIFVYHPWKAGKDAAVHSPWDDPFVQCSDSYLHLNTFPTPIYVLHKSLNKNNFWQNCMNYLTGSLYCGCATASLIQFYLPKKHLLTQKKIEIKTTEGIPMQILMQIFSVMKFMKKFQKILTFGSDNRSQTFPRIFVKIRTLDISRKMLRLQPSLDHLKFLGKLFSLEWNLSPPSDLWTIPWWYRPWLLRQIVRRDVVRSLFSAKFQLTYRCQTVFLLIYISTVFVWYHT